MQTTFTPTYLRSHQKEIMDQTCDSHAPVEITRSKGRSVVILSKEDYNALDETAHLLKSPKNALRLLQAITDNGENDIKFESIEELKNELGI